MSKAVMISIQPKWCELIASGKKIIEVRKTRPQIKTPFKCYIYCTKPKRFVRFSSWGAAPSDGLYKWENSNKIYGYGEDAFFRSWADDDKVEILNGKVIGEFICDRIEVIACHKYHNGVGFDYTYYTESKDTLTDETQLTDYEMQQYLGSAGDGECVGYAWHISDLKIYDTPKELVEFCTACNKTGNDDCGDCPYLRVTRCSYPCDDDIDTWCGVDNKKPITRPPQSWCYVEEV